MLVDATVGHSIFSLTGAFSGYNQIKMYPYDAKKTTLRTPIDNSLYIVMPFGLKNATGTYQRVMTTIFRNMLHDCLENYADDIVIKSKEVYNHVNDLKEVHERCR